MKQPVNLYINWASYDELSDAVPLTEKVAMEQLDHLLKLRAEGVYFDGYMMDCFWYARDGGYRTWRQPHWPEGPDRWLNRCLEENLLPGLWFACNNMAPHCQLDPHPAWEDSLSESGRACAFFMGGFLDHWLESLHIWYEKGFRIFKLDFANLNAAPEHVHARMLPSEVRAANIEALHNGLLTFRREHPEVQFIAYNGFEENEWDTPNYAPRKTMCTTGKTFPKVISGRWLEVMDSIYSGDPRLSDVPTWNFWRSKDLYSNHMVRLYEANGLPLKRIDSSGFMIGNTGTCYFRGKAAWKAMLILTYARGGWMNTLYGDLSLLSKEDARWIRSVQDFFLTLQAEAEWSTFGGIPGAAQPHGFLAQAKEGKVYTVMNPSPEPQWLDLPGCAASSDARVIFSDSGVTPKIKDNRIFLFPEALAVVLTGDLPHVDFGRECDVTICQYQKLLQTEVSASKSGQIRTTLQPADPEADLFIVFQQFRDWGEPVRSTGGWPPDGKPMDSVFQFKVESNGEPLPMVMPFAKQIWSGMSWAAVCVRAKDLMKHGAPIHMEVRTSESEADRLTLKIYERKA